MWGYRVLVLVVVVVSSPPLLYADVFFHLVDPHPDAVD